MNIRLSKFIVPGTLAAETTVLKNRILQAVSSSWFSCSANIDTVAAVGKLPPRTIIHFISGVIGRKYTIARVISGIHTSFIRLASIVRNSLMISRKRHLVRVDPIKIIAIGVEMLPR